MPITLPIQVLPYTIQDGPNKQIFYPQVTYPQDRQFEYDMNQTLVQETQALINKQAEDVPSAILEMLGYFEIKNNQRDVFSTTLSNYTYYEKAAHGLTLLSSVTFDLKEKKRCQLGDLFKADSDYVSRLSEIIRVQIQSRDIPTLHDFTQIDTNQSFYIADKTLVIYFQLYELTPYAYGFPFFPISVYDIQDILNENGPLGRMLAS